MPRFESFEITHVVPRTEAGVILRGVTVEGKVREFALVVHRDTVTNELTLGVARHFSDETSSPFFSDAGVWTEEEMRGAVE